MRFRLGRPPLPADLQAHHVPGDRFLRCRPLGLVPQLAMPAQRTGTLLINYAMSTTSLPCLPRGQEHC
jgi:hypothetical protein